MPPKKSRPPLQRNNSMRHKSFYRTEENADRTINTQVLNANKNPYYLPTVTINLAGNEVISLIDTGAAICLLENTVLAKIKETKHLQMFETKIKVKSISGNILNISHYAMLQIEIGKRIFKHRFYVVNNILSPHYQAIIGYDFLKKYNFQICLQSDTLISKNSIANISDALNPSASKPVNFARVPSKFTLLPGESREIQLKLDSAVHTDDLVKLKSCLRNDNIKISNTLSPVKDNKNISVVITNVSTNNVPMNKNARIGTVTSDFDSRNIEEIKQCRRQELRESDFHLSHLEPKTKSQLLALLFEFSDIFSKRVYTIGRTDAIKPNLAVELSELPSSRPYTVPQALMSELKRQLDELEQANIIEKSNSHISFPLIMIKKKNPSGDPTKQKWRLVTDYRKLNAHLKYPRYKLPIINHLLENLRGDKLFTTLDMSSSFWQIPLKLKDRDITTFTTPFGSYRYITMPQGLSASPEVFCQLSDQVLAPISHLKISNYIDDYCLSSQNVTQMIYKLRKLFERFRHFGLTLNPEKCSFMFPEIQFLGHKLNAEGIKPLDENIIKIKNFPVPTTVKKVRRFHGLVSYYRKFVKHFSELAAPLTNLTKKNQKFRWSEDAQRSFDILKNALAHPPILIHPNYEKTFILSSDSSDTALGAMIGQRDNYGIIHPIAYFSKKLNPTQRKYTIMEKELMAIVEAVKSFKYYLYGRKFIIRCDNSALTKLTKLESPGNRVSRWFAFLSDYDYSFELIKTTDNVVADTLSRDYFVNTTIENEYSNITGNKNKKIMHSHDTQTIENAHTPNTDKFEIMTNNNSETNKILPHFKNDSHTKWSQNFPVGAGLKNLGNTCYLNSVLQCLTHCTPLVNWILRDTIECHTSIFCMICTLRRHMKTAIINSGKVIEPLEIYQKLNFIAENFQRGVQEDAHEYFHYVIDKLQNSSLNHSKREKWSSVNDKITKINHIFEGNLRSEITCKLCKNKSMTFETFKDFNLPISQGIRTLENALDDFVRPKLLQDKYRCLSCKNNAPVIKENLVSKLPVMLTFQFQRFVFRESSVHKMSKYISYPENLNVRPFMSIKEGKPIWYTLNAVLVHSGRSCNKGHYYSYVKDTNGNWYCMNDSKVQRVNLNEVLNQNAYVLYYVRTTNAKTSEKNNSLDDFEINNSHTSESIQSIIPEALDCTNMYKIESTKDNLPKKIRNENKHTANNSENFTPEDFGINSIQISLPTITDIKVAQRKDDKLSKIISILENPSKDSSHRFTDYLLSDGLLMHSAFIPRFRKSTNILQIVIPDKYKPHILTAKHLPHFGLLKTYNSIREHYFWENLYSDTKHFIKSCKHCNSFKSPNKIPPIPIQRNFIPSKVMEFISSDHLGPFPQTNRGNSYILSFIDHYSKYIKLYAVPNTTAQVTAEKFLDFICMFGIPEKYLTDRGTSFTSDLFRKLCEKLCVTKLLTTPLNPRCNGQSEQLNANIKKSLSIFAENTAQWDEYVDYYSLIYNNTVHTATNEKPAYIQFGYDQTLPTDIINKQTPVEHNSYTDYVERRTAQLNYTHKKIQESLLRAAKEQEIYQHRTAKYRNFNVGDLVYLYSPNSQRNFPLPKKKNYIGPMKILHKHNNVNYTIVNANDPKSKKIKVHSHRLIPFTERKPNLDLFHSTIKENLVSNESDTCLYSSLHKPHAVFDENDPDPFLFTQFTKSVRTPKFHATLSNNDDPSTSDSSNSNTIVYSPPEANDHVSENRNQNNERSPYFFRNVPGRNLADRLFDFSLRITE